MIPNIGQVQKQQQNPQNQPTKAPQEALFKEYDIRSMNYIVIVCIYLKNAST